MSNALPEVLTTVPSMTQRERAQWRIAYAVLQFFDDTLGVVALATAQLGATSERALLDTADAILMGMMLTYPGLDTLLAIRVSDSSLTFVDSLTAFERRHAIEYGALYFQMSFLERVEVAYERIAAHTPLQIETFRHDLERIWQLAEFPTSETGA